MPWSTPTLKEVRGLVRDNIRGQLPGADASIPNSVLRVMSDTQGALCHLTLQYIDWLALQLIPDTAEREWLDRHGDIWLVNSDGTTGRKMATLAEGTIEIIGTAGTVVPQFTQFTSGAALVTYESLEEVVLLADAATPVPARALDPGAIGNLEPGTALAGINLTTGVLTSVSVVEMQGGTDEENDDDLRMRVLNRIRQPPMGGAKHDYVRWSLAVPGCTRAWSYPNEMGIGTVTVRVMFDDLRADNDGFPFSEDLDTVTTYLDTVRPVAVKDRWVLAPIKYFIDVHIDNLVPDDEATRGEIEANLLTMLAEKAAPGQTIFSVWKTYAVMSSANVVSFDLTNNTDDVMPTPGHMAVLRDIYYGPEPTPYSRRRPPRP